MTRPVTPDIQKKFHDDGFAIIENILDPAELQGYRRVFDDLVVKADQNMEAQGVENQGITLKGKRYFIGFPCLKHEALKRALFNDTMASIVSDLLDPTAFLYWDQCVIKYKDEKSSFAWHQDSGYGPVERPHRPYLTCWLALDDVSVEMARFGCCPMESIQKAGIIWSTPGAKKRKLEWGITVPRRARR